MLLTGPAAHAERVSGVQDAAGQTYTQQFTQPNTAPVTATYTLSGDTAKSSNGATATFPGKRSNPGQYTPNNMPQGTNIAQPLTTVQGCAVPANSFTECLNRGQLVISFDRPVDNPRLHIAGLGGGVTPPNQQQIIWAAAGRITGSEGGTATISKPAGGTNLVVEDGHWRTQTTRPSPVCDQQSGNNNGTAGCGTIQINGTGLTSITFDLSVYIQNPNNQAYTTQSGQGDEFNVHVSLPDQPVPTANPDRSTTGQGNPVTVDVQANDDAADGYPIQRGEIRLGAPNGGSVSDDGKTATLAGVGTWTVNSDNNVVFTPEASFTGDTPELPYTITDSAGSTASSNLIITVEGTTPSPQPDSATTDQGQAVNLDVLGNDTAQDGTTLDRGSVQFEARDSGGTVSDNGKRLEVPGEGVYTVNDDGQVTFTPEPGFSGNATQVGYSVADSNGNRASTTIDITVNPVPPRPQRDDQTTQQNTPITFDPLANDQRGIDDGTPLDPASVVFPADANQDRGTVSNDGKRLTTPEGVFDINPDNGQVTFTPAENFSGTVPDVTYQVSDTAGQTGTTQIGITVDQAQPQASDDSATTQQGEAVTLDILANDNAGNANTPLDPTTVQLTVGDSNGQLSDDGKTLTVPGEGRYTVDPDTGAVTFTPEPGFSGQASRIGYTVADSAGNTTSANINVNVEGAPPRPQRDDRTTQQNTPITFDPLANDERGIENGTPLDPTTVRFPADANSDRGTVSNDGRTLTTDQGVFEINPDNGQVTFTPAENFSGTVPDVTYEVADTKGLKGTTQIGITVAQAEPQAQSDSATTGQGQAVTINILGNDVAGNENTPLDPSSVRLTAGDTGGTLSDDGKTLTVDGEGTYTVNDDGTVTFTPVPSFTGQAQQIGYTVADTAGNVTDANINVNVNPAAPRANPDTATTPQNTPVKLNPLANDQPGVDGGTPLVPGSVVFPATGNERGTVSNDGKRLTVPEGVFDIDPETGEVTFTPRADFSGTVPQVTYQVSDENGQSSTSTIEIEVTAVTPVAEADRAETQQGKPVTINILGNDRAGSDQAPLDPSTVRLTPGNSGGTVSDDGKTLTVPGEGVYTVNEDGTVTFRPDPAFTGQARQIGYTVADSNGTVTSSTIDVNVTPKPNPLQPDTASGKKGQPVVIDPIANDGDPNLDRTSVRLIAPNVPGSQLSPDGRRLVVPGEGVYTVDPETGVVTFTPDPDFTGVATPIGYSVADADGVRQESTITITITPDEPVPGPGDPGVPPPAPGQPGVPPVPGPGVPPPPAPGQPEQPGVPGPPELPHTGLNTGGILAVGLVALLSGALLVVGRRLSRRQA